jgi:malto-oligosyltrehalose trehalohydrolase
VNEARAFGPILTSSGVVFRLWAPAARRVDLVGDYHHPMRRSDDGWFEIAVAGAQTGTRYQFRINDEIDVPDPASRFQPDDVHGPSEVIDPEAYQWQTQAWAGRPWQECSILELHTGTFAAEGTFRAAIDKLDHVATTGFTAIELMPVADFPGRWNWGYDGVLLYAPDSAYGRPDDLKALVDAAHARGLMVFLDVVYNHFGPDGNYLGRYAPAFFSGTHTPWGPAIGYRNPWVRRFAIDNALHWLRDYRFDGLRLDAVHAIVEPDRTTLLRELSEATGRLAAASHRHIHLVLENDANQASLLDPVTDPAQGRYRAQWNDDYHHAFHVLLTDETAGYYGDYRLVQRRLARALAQGFAYQGEPSPHRNGAPRGDATSGLPATAFVNFLQNHDQIGNRALGERLSELAAPPALECALAVTLLCPGPPLMFMGDEWGTRQPFPFFCDFKGDLADAVRDGRRREFVEAYARDGDAVPDPLARAPVKSATLDWSAPNEPAGAARLDLVRRLLAARKSFIVSRLPDLVPGYGEAAFRGDVLTARWRFGTGEALSLIANLCGQTQPCAPARAGETIWGDKTADLAPWSVHATIEAP